MTRLSACARRLWLLGLMTGPVLAQTQGCVDTSTTNALRESVAAIFAGVAATGLTLIINDYVNRVLDVPTSMFGF